MVTLNQGELITLFVYNGSNGFAFDSTGHAATITNNTTATPEPATMLVLGVNLGGTAARFVQKHNRYGTALDKPGKISVTQESDSDFAPLPSTVHIPLLAMNRRFYFLM